jgi:hypothetical protein
MFVLNSIFLAGPDYVSNFFARKIYFIQLLFDCQVSLCICVADMTSLLAIPKVKLIPKKLNEI